MAASPHRIVFLERESLAATVRRPAFAHTWSEYDKLEPEAVITALADATIAIVNKTRLDAAVLARLPQLRLIALTATGTDNVDLGWCRDHDIAVSNVRNYAVHTVPEHTFALILALRRSLFAYARDIAAGRWQ
ncbi:MAG: glycerate dehydrogenase, partial [Betaproteobacteria bacterium]